MTIAWGGCVAAISGGCAGLVLTNEGERSRVFAATEYDDAFRATSRVLADRYGNVRQSDRAGGLIRTGPRAYNPAGLGPGDLGRLTNPGGYQSRAEARVEKTPQGARVAMRVVVERYEYDRRASAAGLSPTDDILFDDRRPNTPLQEALYAGPGRGGRWQPYRTDTVVADELLRAVEGLLNPAAVVAPTGKPAGTDRPPADTSTVDDKPANPSARQPVEATPLPPPPDGQPR